MKNPELFHKSISVLVKAYLNNTLIKGECTACAVGNLISAACNFKIIKENHIKWVTEKGNRIYSTWDMVFTTVKGVQRTYPKAYEGNSKEQIDSTGYTWQELARIEKAFECSKDMFEGLMNVVDVLGEIHEVDKEEISTTKLLFVK